MTLKPNTFAFSGGLDVSSAALAVPPGRIVSGINYEPIAEGYARSQGFERYDGRDAPSEAQFWVLSFDGGAIPMFPGDTVEGGTSGATGYILLDPVGFTGSWSDGTAAGTLVLGRVNGTFQDNEVINVAGSPRASADGTAYADSAMHEITRRTYLQAAQEHVRNLVNRVPGTGPVRGVHVYRGDVFAFRDSSLALVAKMYRGTGGGWVEVDLGRTLPFSSGLTEISEGATITGATSGAIATAKRVVRNKGDWGSTASGFIVLESPVGDFSAGESIRVDAVDVATADAASAPITLPQGGRYMGINHNFYGASNMFAAYFVNGVGPAFEFDGETVVPILTGMPYDRPTRIFEIANHLGLTFPGGSVQLSSIGQPVLFDAIQGAAEIGFGTEITDVLQSAETAVVLFGEEKISILSGTDDETFQLQELTEEAGAYAWTAQSVGKRIYLDARGLRDITATQTYGNFKTGLLSEIIEPYFKAKRKAKAKPVLSYVCRGKSQYRLIWDDRTGLTVYFGRNTPEAIPFTTDDVDFYCVGTGEMADGEGMFAGANDGYVYRLDSGTSFDGARIKGFVMTPFNHLGSVTHEKNLRKTTVELQAEPMTQIGITAMFDYSDGYQPISGDQDFIVQGSGKGHDFIVSGGGGIWDASAWNSFFWSSPYSGKAEAWTEGQGVNMSIIIACNSALTEGPHTLQAYTLHTLARKART